MRLCATSRHPMRTRAHASLHTYPYIHTHAFCNTHTHTHTHTQCTRAHTDALAHTRLPCQPRGTHKADRDILGARSCPFNHVQVPHKNQHSLKSATPDGWRAAAQSAVLCTFIVSRTHTYIHTTRTCSSSSLCKYLVGRTHAVRQECGSTMHQQRPVRSTCPTPCPLASAPPALSSALHQPPATLGRHATGSRGRDAHGSMCTLCVDSV
jgi:hypothetical protein